MANNSEVFDSYFRRADTDRDGRISGAEAVAFFQGANLPQVTLAKIWQFVDQEKTGYLSRPEFYNALKLITVAQTGRELSAELVKAALTGPAAAQIPPPRINPLISPSAGYGQAPPPSQPPSSAPQGVFGGFAAHPLSSQGSGGLQILQGQPQGRFPPPVSSQMQLQTLLRLAPPTSAVLQPQAPTGSSYPTTDSLWPTPNTPSFPIASQFLSSANVPPASSFQSVPTSGTLRPTATWMQIPLTTAQALDSSGEPWFQAGADLFGGAFKATGRGSSSLKTDAHGDLFSVAPTARPSGALHTKSTSPLLGFGDSSSRADTAAPLALVPTTLAPTAALGKSLAVSQALPSLSMPQDMGPGLSARAFPGQGQGPPWPRMTQNDVQRYMQVFSKVDTDHDGKITGDQARDLFLSWQLPREILKQVWNLSDQDGDSMLSIREFCTALYFMERFREGRTLPATVPSGIHLDDWNLPGVPDGPKTKLPENYGGTGQPHMQGQSLAGRPELGTQGPFSEFNSVEQVQRSETIVPGTKRGDVDEAKKKVFEHKERIMDHKEKADYYRTKLQEIVLFKSRCDNKLAEITERAAADKREVESLAKKYNEKYNVAADLNTQLAAGEAAHRGIQERKVDIFNALAKMEHGGNTNSLLQSRVDRISTDLDELRKALNERSKHLGIEVKEKPPTETPFAWQPGIQENATHWDDEWDKFDKEGFTAVQDFMEHTAGGTIMSASSAKPSDAASWAVEEESAFEKGTDFSMSTSVENKVDLPPEESVSVPKQVPADLQSTKVIVSNRDDSEINSVSRSNLLPDNKTMPTFSANVAKASERYAGVVYLQEFGGDILNGPTLMTSLTNSSEQGQISLKSHASDLACGNDKEADSGMHSSSGLQKNRAIAPVNTTGIVQGLIRPGKVAAFHGFTGGSSDVGSPQTSSVDEILSPTQVLDQNGNSYRDSVSPLALSKDSRVSSFFGGNIAQSTSLFTSSPSSTKRGDGFGGSFLHFDSFGPGSPVAPRRVSGASEDQAITGSFLNRFDSFNSVRTDVAPGSGFHSDDDSDLFAGTGPFGATNQHNSDGWKAF